MIYSVSYTNNSQVNACAGQKWKKPFAYHLTES